MCVLKHTYMAYICVLYCTVDFIKGKSGDTNQLNNLE